MIEGAGSARADAERLLLELAATIAFDHPVVEGRMFNGLGLQVKGRLFVFASHEGGIIAKVPADAAAALVARGAATPVTMGRRTMREWVGVAAPAAGAGFDGWRDVVEQAYAYVSRLEG
jgi:hypothetical protein